MLADKPHRLNGRTSVQRVYALTILPPVTALTVGLPAQRIIAQRFRAMPSRPGEFHPEPLTEPDLTLSRHPARATARRLPPSIEHRVPPVAG